MKTHLALILMVLCTACTKNNSGVTKEQEIRQMLNENGGVARVAATHRQYIEQGKVRFPNVSAEAWQKLDNEVSVICEELLEVNIRIYADNFTQDELHEVHVFYNSPVGKKFFSQFSRLQQESAQKNLPLAQKFESAYLRTVRDAGYDTKSMTGE